MLAVQCRSWNRDAEGAVHYERLLAEWKPGPVMAHQTYANHLDKLKRYGKASDQRHIAVAMEPCGWTYDGLGNTLNNLERFKEGNEAHAKAVECDPNRANYWA